MSSLKLMAMACVLGSLTLGCTHATDGKTHSPMHASNGATLQTHYWRLAQVRGLDGSVNQQWQRAVADSRVPVQLQFTDEKALIVERLCNNMHGGYEVQGNVLHINRMVSTMMACGDKQMMSLEHNVAQQLPKVQSWAIEGSKAEPVLVLTFQGDVVWELKGKPTYETRYGPSQQIFLEVAPDTVTCLSPKGQNTQCLQVREVKYDTQGIKQSVGSWSNYYGSIEGYTKHPGERNILRIKRYSNSQEPVNAPKHVDVLDLVVESEVK